MNLLENKEFLRGLLKQSDLINTINGGSVMATSNTENTDQGIVIKVTAPSLPAESWQVFVDKTNLNIYSTIKSNERDEDENRIQVPLFLKTFKIPAEIDAEKIEAYFESDELRVMLPFKDKNNLQRFVTVNAL